MSYQHDITIVASTPGGSVSKHYSNDGAQHSGYFNDALTADATTSIPNFAVDVSQMTSLVISCDRDVTLNINGSTPSIDILAGKPLIWDDSGYFSNPFGGSDVTSIDAVLAAGDTATLLIDVCYD